MPAGVHWTTPHGGLYFWLTLPAGIDTARGSAFFKECVERGVLYVPGDYCFQPDETTGRVPRNHLRLSFGQVAPDKIVPGVERLAEAVRRQTGTAAPHAVEPAAGGAVPV
jgi:2-aminoadipate transaminase